MLINNGIIETKCVPHTTDNLSQIETQNWQICQICQYCQGCVVCENLACQIKPSIRKRKKNSWKHKIPVFCISDIQFNLTWRGLNLISQ